MVFALVHFTVGFVAVLAVLAIVPITRYRLTGGYVGGIWALFPDIHQIAGGALGERARDFHDSSRANVFFFHRTLDTDLLRALTVELTFVSLAVLGVTFVLYDWRSGVARS